MCPRPRSSATAWSGLLLLAGVVTAVPLVWFMHGAQRLKYATLGLMQYLAPTSQLILAVFAYGEPFRAPHAVAFACIWTSLALYTSEALGIGRARSAA